ncbi:MAG: glycosyltransferase [Chryseolinea sp.]
MAKDIKRVLFIAWDSASVSYLEGLFIPIFIGLQKHDYQFHVIQFSWASKEKVHSIELLCNTAGIAYTHKPIELRPIATVGKFITTYLGGNFVRHYIKKFAIDIVIPRSTMPASMVVNLKRKLKDVGLAFDADGLPIDERVDFAGLRVGSFRHRKLEKIEGTIITNADVVLTRTSVAADYLSKKYKAVRSKFIQVTNGRNPSLFNFSEEARSEVRSSLGIPMDATVLVYCGSIGPQYGVDEMLYIHKRLREFKTNVFLLVITNNVERMNEKLKNTQGENVVVKGVPVGEVPMYLSAADISLALRKDAFSMVGVSPIKLGEYLLMGLPVVASARIGDTEQILKDQDFAFVLDNFDQSNLDNAISWLENVIPRADTIRTSVREFAMPRFSLERSVETYHMALSCVQ